MGLYLTFAVYTYAAHYDVYLLAGQSNAGGHGYISREYAYFSPNGDDGLVELGKTEYLQPQANAIFYHWRGGTPSAARPTFWDMRTNGWIAMKAGYSLYGYNSAHPEGMGEEMVYHPFGAEVTFAEEMARAMPDRKIAIIKYSQGATSLGTAASPGDWDPGRGKAYVLSSYANPGHCYAGFLRLIEQSLQSLQAQGHSYTICGMIWHQGESDAGLSVEVYKTRLKEFIAAVRTDLNVFQMPFLIGELPQMSSYANIRTAQQQAAAETENAAFVASVGLGVDSTVIHFNTESNLVFGRRYADRMLSSGRSLRQMTARWRLDEASLCWNGSAYVAVIDGVSAIEGALYGYSQTDQAFVNALVLNQAGPCGPNDKAYDFAVDGGISGINTNRPDALPAADDFSLLVRMKTSDLHTSQGHLFSNNSAQAGRANLYIQNGALGWFHNGGVSISETNSPIFDGLWHTVGVVRTGDHWSLLRDGQIVAAADSSGSIGQNVEWMIGRMRAYNGNYEGQIADVRVYNYAVTQVADLNDDGRLDGLDFNVLSSYWLDTDCGACGGADINLDTQVSIEDFIMFLENWLI